jgi:hypothetical protein
MVLCCVPYGVFMRFYLDLRFAGRLISSRSGHHHRFPTVYKVAEMAGCGSLDDVVVVHNQVWVEYEYTT